MSDPINHPEHYTALEATCHKCSGRIECIDVTGKMSFTLGNVIKYIWRADYKNGLEDLNKALWYLQREIRNREIAATNKVPGNGHPLTCICEQCQLMLKLIKEVDRGI